MKNNNQSKTNNQLNRFNHLKSLYRAAPLAVPDFEELKQLAKKYDPKMAKYLDENPNA